MKKDEKARKPQAGTIEAAGTPAAGQDARLTEREKFISLLSHHSELCPVLLRILTPQEPPHEAPEVPHRNDG